MAREGAAITFDETAKNRQDQDPPKQLADLKRGRNTIGVLIPFFLAAALAIPKIFSLGVPSDGEFKKRFVAAAAQREADRQLAPQLQSITERGLGQKTGSLPFNVNAAGTLDLDALSAEADQALQKSKQDAHRYGGYFQMALLAIVLGYGVGFVGLHKKAKKQEAEIRDAEFISKMRPGSI